MADDDYWRDKRDDPFWREMLKRAEACYENLRKARATTPRAAAQMRMERQDCIQEFIAAAWAVRDEGDDSPLAWAHRNRCGVNAVKNHLRFAGRKLHNPRLGVGMSHPGVSHEVGRLASEEEDGDGDPLSTEDVVADSGKSPLENVLAGEAREVLMSAVDDLPERLRLTVLVWLEAEPSGGRHSTERAAASAHRRTMESAVAERMGLSRDEAGDLTERALESLRHRLEWRGYGLDECLRHFAVKERETSHAARFRQKNLARTGPVEDEADDDGDGNDPASEENDSQTPC